MRLLLLASLFSTVLCFGVEEAKYVLNFESQVYVTAGEEYVDCSRIVCERYNETTAYMYGEVEFLKPVDNLNLEVILKKEASGKQEVLFSHDICDLCAELGDEGSDYRPYLRYLGIPDICPFDVGSYEIRNLIVDITDFDIKDQQCGAYMAELNMYQSTGENCKNDKELIFVIKVDLTIERC